MSLFSFMTSIFAYITLFPKVRLSCVICVGMLISQSALGVAEDLSVNLSGITLDSLNKYKEPVLVDRVKERDKIKRLISGIEALKHMANMVNDEHERKALLAQITSLKSVITELQNQIQYSPSVRHTPLSSSSKAQTQSPNPQTKMAIDQIRFAHLWRTLENADFRNDKMKVIRQIARSHYLKVDQARLFIESLTFSKDRKQAILILYPKVVDRDQIHELYSLLDHKSDQQEVIQSIQKIDRSVQRKKSLLFKTP